MRLTEPSEVIQGPSGTQLPLRRQTMLHTTSYLHMKADAARTFLLAIATMVISVIPTWRTQHEAYIQARLKLVTSLEEETILAAMVADHAARHNTALSLLPSSLLNL